MSIRLGSPAPSPTTANYADNQLGIEQTTQRIIYTVANQPCYVQYATGISGGVAVWEDADTLVLPCFSTVVENVYGVRFKTAAGVAPALIVAELFTPADPIVSPNQAYPTPQVDALTFSPPPGAFQSRPGEFVLADNIARLSIYSQLGPDDALLDIIAGQMARIEVDNNVGGFAFIADAVHSRARIALGNQPLTLDSAKTVGGTPAPTGDYLCIELGFGNQYLIPLWQ